MDNLLQGCCIFFLYFLTSSTKGIFLKSTEFHYIDKLVIPSILYGFFGQPTTRDHSEQQEESKSMWLEGLDPPFTTVAMKAFWLQLQKSSGNCSASVLGFKNKVILHCKKKLGWVKLNRSYLMVSQNSLLSACFYVLWAIWPKVFHPVRANEWPL